MTKTLLMGTVRRSNGGKALKLSISVEAFERAEHYSTQDGREYVAVIMRLDQLNDMLDGKRDLISLTQTLGD